MQLDAPNAVAVAVPPLAMAIMAASTSVQLRTISSLETDELYSAGRIHEESIGTEHVAPTSPAPLMLLMRTSM